MERFSKQSLSNWVHRRIARLEEEYKFDRRNGSAQTKGKGEAFSLAYGEFSVFRDMISLYDLPEPESKS